MSNFMLLSKALTAADLFNEAELSVYEIIFGAVLIIAALLIIFVVLLQEGRQSNVGVISGAADSFMDKGAAKSLDQKLSKWTKVIAVIFFLLVLGFMMVSKFLSNEARNAKLREENKATVVSTVASQSVSPAPSSTNNASSTTNAAGTTSSTSADATESTQSASESASTSTNATL